MKPIIDGYASTIEVDPEAEESFVRNLDTVLAETVFAAGCSNWYINSAGRNSAAWPGLAATFWKATFFPKWNDFVTTGGSVLWPVRKLGRNLWGSSTLIGAAVAIAVAGKALTGPVSLPRSALTLVNQLKM